MSYILETTIRRWIGLSTDDKPTPGYVDQDGVLLTTRDVPAGSTFKDERGYISTFNGTTWNTPVKDTDQPIVDAITMLTAEVAKLRLGMIDVGTASEASAEDALAVIAA